MRLIMSAVFFAAASFALMPTSSADGSRAVTSWTFVVSYSTGQYSESQDPTESGPLLMYTGASWRCSRTAVSLNNDGNLVAGFFCSQPVGTGQVFVTVRCSPTADSGDYASSTISDSTTKAFMRLSVGCTTKVPARPAVSKSAPAIEKDL